MKALNKQALREAAEKATPGRVGDRIDGSGSIKYECHGYDGSLVLRTDHKNMEYGFIGDNSNADELFFRLCVPDVILALLDELEAAEKRIAEQREYYEGVIADGSRRIAELEAKIETSDKLQDSAFRHGLQHGFSYGQTNDQARYEQCIAAYSPKKIADGIITKVGG